eukprot:TRINITY_DN12276_c0_g1_i1.p1 TRINITY_DN12276_c0_g1~~TRINITY_DN12276_c0_g1_i1.p1  ORF type:complete len:319 (+),score=57.39 TRINITY_DN12276_c0_g1_i1:44-1000(+)
MLYEAATALLCCILFWKFLPPLFERRVEGKGKFVVVTGCDTGFGQMLSAQLDSAGFSVIAACFTEKGTADMRASLPRAHVLRLDVTSDESVATFHSEVKRITPTLWALVNNAGILNGYFCDLSTMQHYIDALQVNCLGGIRMCKSLWPLLAANTPCGRVVNITSMAGRVVPDAFSCYGTSKFAFAGFSEAFRREMARFGVHVSIVEPYFMKTPLLDGHAERWRTTFSTLPAEVQARWGTEFVDEHSAKAVKTMHAEAGDAAVTVNALFRAVATTRPQARVQVAPFTLRLVCYLPEWLIDWVLKVRSKTKAQPVGVSQK